jgi:hypothetical protein
MRNLRGEGVDLQGAEQADGRAGHARRDLGETVQLGHVGVSESVEAAPCVLELAPVD